MKIMLKKCIAIVMMIFILSSSIVINAAEEAAPVETSPLTEAQIETYNEDLDFLKSVGIWTSPQTDPVLTVTRGEFASAIAGLCNLDAQTNATLKYSDVNAETLFVEDIYAVGIMNLMVGSDGMFRPEENLTINQAVKTVVCALGYEAIANARGGYPDGYYSVAIDLGLIVGKGRDEVMTRRDVVDIITRACFVEVMDIKGINADNLDFQINKKNDALAIYHDIYELKGIFTDDGLTNLKGATKIPGNGVIIAGKRLSNETVKTDGYMGSNVIAYYNFKEDKLIYLKENPARNNILTVKAEDLIYESEKFKKTNVVYKKNKKTEEAEVSPYADFIYNGSAYPAFMVDDLKIKSGSLKFIDNDLDRTYDVVIAEEFVNHMLLSNNQVNQFVADSNGTEIHYGEYAKFEFLTTNGEEKAISLLKSNSILSVFASKDDTRIKIIVSEDKVDGKVTALEKYDEKEIVTIIHSVEGEQVETPYEYSATYLEHVANNVSGYDMPAIDDELTIRLDFEGRIAGIEDYKDQYHYAYFLAAGRDDGSKLAGKCLVKLCLDSGDIATVATAKKIIINGVETKNGNEILNVKDLYVDENPASDFRRQVVKIKTTSIGELKEIVTTNDADICKKATGFDPTRFCLVYKTPAGSYSEYYNAKRNSFSGKYIMDEKTVIFLVPADSGFDEKYIKVIPHEKLYELARRSNVRMYDADEFWTVGAVEVISQPGTGFLPKAMTVIKSVRGINADGEDIYMVTGRYKDEEYTFREERPGVIDSVVPGGLKFGDIVAIKVDENYNIIDLKMRVRTSEAAPFYEVTGNADTGEGVFYGHVYARNDKVITLSTDNGATVRAHAIATGPKPVIIDYVNHEVRQGTYADVPVSAMLDADGNFVYTDDGVSMYIYRYSGYINDCILVIK